MASAFMKEWLLLQQEYLGLTCVTKGADGEPVVDVKQTLREAGYSTAVPTDDIPVAYLPGMLRLDKESWLNCVSVEASFSNTVEDGDLVCPVRADTTQGLMGGHDAIWKSVRSGAGTTPSGTQHLWGFAYKHVGRVLLGPAVFYQSFTFPTGTFVYADTNGKLTSVANEYLVGVCVAPGTILIKHF